MFEVFCGNLLVQKDSPLFSKSLFIIHYQLEIWLLLERPKGGAEAPLWPIICFTTSFIYAPANISKQLPKDKSIKLIYMGKLLRENETLLSQGWKEGNAVSAFVFSII